MGLIIDDTIDNGNPFDWGKTSTDYAKFRDIYPELFYQKITDLGLCVDGQKILDLGTGTGVLPRNMYKYGANFVGADISANQIAQAKQLSQKAGMDIDYLVSSAEDVTFPNETFDVITACQCFEYFNKPVVLPKIQQMLKENGHFCIVYMAWLPAENEIAQKSEDLVLKYNPFWSGGGMQRHFPEIPSWANNLFEKDNSIMYDLTLPFTRESWHGRMKACRGIGASALDSSTIEAWEKEHLEYLVSVPESFDIPHFASILNLRKISP